MRRTLSLLISLCAGFSPAPLVAQSYQTAFAAVKFDRAEGPATVNGGVEVEAATGAASITLPIGPGIGQRGLHFAPTLSMRIAPQLRISTTEEYHTVGSDFSEHQYTLPETVDTLYHAGFGSASFSPGTLDLGTMVSTVDRNRTSYSFPGGGGRVLGSLPAGMTADAAQALLSRFGFAPSDTISRVPWAGTGSPVVPFLQMGSDGSLVLGLRMAGPSGTVTDEVADTNQILPDPPLGTPMWNFPRRMVVIHGDVAYEYHYVDHTYMTRHIPYLATGDKTQLYRAHYVLMSIRNRFGESIAFSYEADGIGYTATWSTHPSVKIRVAATGTVPVMSAQARLLDSRFILSSATRIRITYEGISQPVSPYHIDLADPLTGGPLALPADKGPGTPEANAPRGQRDYDMTSWGAAVQSCQPVEVVEEDSNQRVGFTYAAGPPTTWGGWSVTPVVLAQVAFPTRTVALTWEPYRFRLNYSPEAWGGVVMSSSSTRPAYAYGVVQIDDSDGTQVRRTRHDRVVPTSNWTDAPIGQSPAPQWVDRSFYDAITFPDGSVTLHQFVPPPANGATSGAESVQNLAFIKALEYEVRSYVPGVDWKADLTVGDPASSSAYRWVVEDRFDFRTVGAPTGSLFQQAVPYPTRVRTWDKESQAWTEEERTDWDPDTYGWRTVHRLWSIQAPAPMVPDYPSLALQSVSYQPPSPTQGLYRRTDRTFDTQVQEWFIARSKTERTTTFTDTTIPGSPAPGLPDRQPEVAKTYNPTINRVESVTVTGADGQAVSTIFTFLGSSGLQAGQVLSAYLQSPGRPLSGQFGVSAYGYDANGYLASIGQQPNASTLLAVSQTQDELGRPLTQVDMNGKVQRFDWDSSGRLERITPPDGEVPTLISYDDTTHRGITVTRGAQVSEYRYNGFGELVLERRRGADGTWSHRLVGRDVLGRETGQTVWLPEGAGTEQEWAKPNLTRPSSQTLTTTKTICRKWGFDERGNAVCLDLQTLQSTTTVSLPAAYLGSATVYDGRGRISRILDPSGVLTTTEYFGPGQLPPRAPTYLGPIRKVTVGGRQVRWIEYDAASRLVRITTPVTAFAGTRSSATPTILNLQSVYRYDGGDRVREVRQVDQSNRAQVRSWTYNSLGWLTDLTQPESGWTHYSDFTVAGSPMTTSYAGRVVHSTPDWIGRILSVSAEDRTVTQAFVYDTAPGGLGRLASSTDGGVSTRYAYEGPGGRMSSLSTEVPVAGVSQPFLQTFRYDAYGNRISGTTGHAEWTQTYHSASGLPDQLSLGGKSVASTPWPYYDPISWALVSVAYGNKAASQFIYKPDQIRLAEVKHMDGAMGITADWAYEYDEVGDLFREYDKKRPDGAGGFRFDQYTYDELNRLVSAVVQTSAYGEQLQQFDYDAFGNRISSNLVRVTSWSDIKRAIPAAVAHSPLLDLTERPIANVAFTEGSDALLGNRLPGSTSTGVSTGAAYDPQGNLTRIFEKPGDSSRLNTLDYDALGRVIRIGNTRTGLSEQYRYTAEGLRTVVEVSLAGTLQKTRINLYNDNRQLVSQWEGAPTKPLAWRRDVVYLGTREAGEWDAAGLHVTQLDHLGSPRIVTGPLGAVESTQKYLPFGELIEQTGTYITAKGFTNHEQTEASGMIYMQARFYLPWYGRFTAPDPARDQHFEDTQSWNIYSYVRNNPVMGVDPTGMNDQDSRISAPNRRNGADQNETAVRETLNEESRKPGEKDREQVQTADLTLKSALGGIPTITYSSDVTGKLNGQLYAAVNYAMVANGIDTINISAISNGDTHAPHGGHYDSPITSAVDINIINGQHVGANDPYMKKFYEIMVAFLNKTGSAKAAYGPDSVMDAKGRNRKLTAISHSELVQNKKSKHYGKSRAAVLLDQHSTHFHFSVQDQSTFARPVKVVWQ